VFSLNLALIALSVVTFAQVWGFSSRLDASRFRRFFGQRPASTLAAHFGV
jgi:hypothetical protein